MTLEELKQTDWYEEKPKVIKKAICKLPPIQIYKFKNSDKQCIILSFEEPESGKLKDVTCTVKKTGIGGALEALGLSMFDTNYVSNVKLDDLEPLV